MIFRDVFKREMRMSRLKTGVMLDVSRYHGNEYFCLYLSFLILLQNSLDRSFDKNFSSAVGYPSHSLT